MNEENSIHSLRRRRLVVYIEKRALFRDCLSKCLLSSREDEAVISFGSIDECCEADVQSDAVAAILYGVAQAPDVHSNLDEDLDRLAAAFPAVPIMLLSDCDTNDDVLRAIETGVRGYISTNTSLDVAIGATHVVRAGGSFIPESCLVSLRPGRGDDDPGGVSRPEEFTPRQIEVLKRLRQGKPNRVIASELDISESRVKAHIRNLMQKLHATNRTQVAFLTKHFFPSGRSGRSPGSRTGL